MKYARSLVRLRIDERLSALRKRMAEARDPSPEVDTLQYLLYTVRSTGARRILEIGTGEGVSGAAMLLEAPDAFLVTVEKEEERRRKAEELFDGLGLSGRVHSVLGDAADLLRALETPFDLIFLDGPKAQYLAYLPDLKRLLKKGGVLFADDVFLFGWVSGEVPAPAKRMSIVNKLRGFLEAVSDDPELITCVLDLGDGVSVSVKK